MEQAVKELSLTPIHTPWTEYAWKFSDYPTILAYFRDRGCIVLGGDILTLELDHTLDNWYYTPDPTLSREENVRASCEKAEAYLARYQAARGIDHYIVFVI